MEQNPWVYMAELWLWLLEHPEVRVWMWEEAVHSFQKDLRVFCPKKNSVPRVCYLGISAEISHKQWSQFVGSNWDMNLAARSLEGWGLGLLPTQGHPRVFIQESSVLSQINYFKTFSQTYLWIVIFFRAVLTKKNWSCGNSYSGFTEQLHALGVNKICCCK